MMRRIQDWFDVHRSLYERSEEEIDDDNVFENGDYLDDGDLYDDGVTMNDDHHTADGEMLREGGMSFWSLVILGGLILVLCVYATRSLWRSHLERKQRNTFQALSNGAKEITESFDIGMVEFGDEDERDSDMEAPTKAEEEGVYS